MTTESVQPSKIDKPLTGGEALAAAAAVAAPVSAATANYSHDSERLVIGIILNEQRSTLHHALMSLLSPEDFFVEQHKAIWQLVAGMREAGIVADPVSVLDHAKTQRTFVGGAAYITESVQDPVARMCTDEAVTAAASRIKNFSMARLLQRSLSMATALSATGQDYEYVTLFLEDELNNLKRLSTSHRSGPKHASYYYDLILAKLMAKLNGEEVQEGAKTQFPEFDRLLGGYLPREDLIVIAGRPAMGKTAFATALEQNISNSGTPTLLFSMEMTGVSISQRNISRHSRIPYSNIRANELTDREFDPFTETLQILGAAPSYIDETPGLSMSEIRARARTFIAKHPDGVIFLDYMQIIQPGRDSKAKDPKYLVAETSQGLKQMARELKCPVIALAQLSRGVEQRANKRPLMSDLRESGQIEQDASIIIFLYRDEYYNPDSEHRGVTEAIFAKNRDSECATVRFASTLAYMHYSEMGAYATAEA